MPRVALPEHIFYLTVTKKRNSLPLVRLVATNRTPRWPSPASHGQHYSHGQSTGSCLLQGLIPKAETDGKRPTDKGTEPKRAVSNPGASCISVLKAGLSGAQNRCPKSCHDFAVPPMCFSTVEPGRKISREKPSREMERGPGIGRHPGH